MHLKLYFGIALLLCFTLQGDSSKSKNDRNRCKRVKHFRKRRSYLYEYRGIVENGIKGTSEKAANMQISATLWIEYITECEYSLQLKDVKLEESFADGQGFTSSPKTAEAAKALEQYPLQFVMEYGLVTELRPALKERQKDILNIKRGILSSLQVNWGKSKESYETTVSGACDIKYDVIKHKDGKKNTTKTIDLSSCKERTMAHSNIESEQYIKSSSIYDARSSCRYLHKKKHEILRAQCEEYYLVKPFSSSNGAGSYTKISQVFILLKSKKVSKIPRQFPEFYSTSLLFEHKHEEKSKSPDATAVEELLVKLVKESSKQAQPGAANRFTELVFLLRTIDERGLGSLLGKLTTCFNVGSCNGEMIEAYWSYFFEALAQCGSTPCVNILANLIMTNKVSADRANDLISSMNFIQEPSTAMLNTVMGIHKATLNTHALLLLGTLMHKLCKHRPDECNGNGPIANVVQNAEFYLMRQLGNECRAKSLEKSNQMYYALKAIGNAGRPIRIKNIILDCVQHAAHANTSIAALHALKRMPLGSKVQDLLRVMLTDRNVDIEKRMESFLVLMARPSQVDILLAIDMVNDLEEARQLRSFIASFLKSVVTNKAPERKKLTNLFKRSLALKNMTDFNPSAARYSKVFEKSAFLDIAGIGGSVNGKMLFHTESFIPRTIRLGINAQALGHAVDFMEIDARMEGLEREMGRFVNEQGFMSKDFFKKAFNIPNFEADEKVMQRSRRGLDDDQYEAKLNELDNEVNLKEPSPQVALSLKIFGNEVRLFSLKDIPFLNGDMDNFNMVHALYSLTKGKSKTLRRSIIFLEGRYVVPTIIGLPLSFAMNGSAVVSLNLEGQVGAKNLIFGPKLLTLKGSILPSVSTEISGKVTVDGVFSKAGMRFNARTHASAIVSGEIKYEEGKEFKVHIDAPKKPVDLFSYKHEMFHVVGSKEVKIDGSKRRTELDLCADELYDSTKIFGVNVCSNMSFPVAYHNLDAPFYPLTGPANVAFTLKKTDITLSKYHLSILKNNDLYRIKLGTPGARHERWIVVNLGITANNEKGVIGATFGNTNRGLILRYQYDNRTHSTEATLVSNITQSEITISGKYFNETNAATLDLKMGLEFDITTQYSSIKQKLIFVDTYEYWGFNWLLDHGKQPISADLKVAYNPQTVFFKFQYGGRYFAVQLQPTFPVVGVDLAINWMPFISNVTLNLDFRNFVAAAVANTTSYSYGFDITRKQQGLVVSLRRDNEIYKWTTSMSYKNNSQCIESFLLGDSKKYGVIISLAASGITATLKGFPGKVRAIWTRDVYSRGITVDGAIGKHSGMVKLHYKTIPYIGLRALCLVGKAGPRYADFCIDVISSAEERSIKLRLDSSAAKLSTALTFKAPNNSSLTLGKSGQEHLEMKTVLNGERVLEAIAKTDKSSGDFPKRRLSLLTVKAGFRNVQIDFKLPTSGSKNGRPETSGWFVVRRDLKDGEQVFEIRSNAVFVSNSLQMKNLYKYYSKEKQHVQLFGYTETSQNNEASGTMNVVRETVYSINDWMAHNKESFFFNKKQMGYEGVFKTVQRSKLNSSTAVSNLQSVKDLLRHVKPYLSAKYSAEEIKKYTGKFYPKSINVEILGNKADFNLDLTKRISSLTLDFKSGSTLDFTVNSASKDRFIFNLDYRNATWDMGTLTVGLAKDPGTGTWQVKIQHPALRTLIGKLRSKYRNEKQKLKMKILSKVNHVLARGGLSEETRKALLVDVGIAFGMDFMTANLSQLYRNLGSKWGGMMTAFARNKMKEVLSKGFENATSSLFKADFGKNPELLKIREQMSTDLSNLVVDIFAMKANSAIKVGKEIGSKLKRLFNQAITGPAFKKIVSTAFQKTLQKQNISTKTGEKLMKTFNDGLASVFENPQNVILFYTNITEVMMEERAEELRGLVKVGLARVVKLMRVHLDRSVDIKLRGKLSGLVAKVEQILIDVRYDDPQWLSQAIKSLRSAFKAAKISVIDVQELVFDIAEGEMKKAGLPEIIRVGLARFTKEQNYAELYHTVMKYCFKALKLEDPMYSSLATKLYKNDVKGIIEVSSLVVADKRLPTEVRLVFSEYLRSFDVYDLVTGLVKATFQKLGKYPKLAEALGRHVASKNLTEFAREALRFGFSKMQLPKEAITVIQELSFARFNRGYFQTIVDLVTRSSNNSQNWKRVLSTLQYSDNMGIVVKTFYTEVINQLKLVPEAKSMLLNFANNKDISSLIKKATLMATTRAFKALNASKGTDTFSFAKMAIFNYMKQGAGMIPTLWQPRLRPIFDVIMQEIAKTRSNDLMANATEVIFRISEKVFLEVSKYVASNFSLDLEKDLKETAKVMIDKIVLGRAPLSHLLKETRKQIKESVMFGLRLTSQLFPDQVREFSKRYSTKTGFRYQKLYSDFLKANFTSEKYTTKFDRIFTNLGLRVLTEITNATGGFSTGTGFLNMLRFVRGLNFTDANSVITSYERMKRMKYTEWSPSVLLQHLRVALKKIGRWDVRNQTIDEHVAPMILGFRTILPRILAVNRKFQVNSDKAFRDAILQITGRKAYFKRLMKNSLTQLRNGFEKWRKIFTFVSDISVPVLSNIPRILDSKRAEVDFTLLKKLLNEVKAWDLIDDLRKFIDRTNGLPVDRSLKDILIKSSKVIELATDKWVLKRLMFGKDVLQEIQTEVTKLLSTMNNFMRSKAGQPLYKFLSKSGKHGFSYLKSSFSNSTVVQKLKQELMPFYNVTDLRQAIGVQLKNLTQKMKKAFDQIDQKSVKKWAEVFVPSVVRNITSESIRVMMQTLGLIDQTRGYLQQNPFFRNPARYLRTMPRKTMMLLAQKINEMKPRIKSWFVATENALKSKVFRARSVYEGYIKKSQDYVNKASVELTKLNHYSSVLKMMDEYSWAKHLSNYTEAISDRLSKSKNLLMKQLGRLGKSDSLEAAFSNATILTKQWLQNMKTTINRDFQNMTLMNQGLLNLQKYEQEASKYHKMAAENLTRIIGEVEQLAWNASSRMLRLLENAGRKIGPGQALVWGKVLGLMETLQQNVTVVKRAAMRYVSLMDDSMIVIRVPGMSKLIADKLRGKGESKVSKESRHTSFLKKHRSPGVPSRQTSVSSTFNAGRITNVTGIATKASGLELFKIKINPLRPSIQRLFGTVNKAFLPVRAAMDNVTRRYEVFQSAVRRMVQTGAAGQFYGRNVLFPLKRLLVSASIPAPAEGLQALGRRENVWQKCSRMFMPSPGSATLYHDHVFTFDGNYVFIPKLRGARRRCAYLLARDFYTGNFTILYDGHQLTLKTKGSSVLFDKTGKIEVIETVGSSVRRINELPARTGKMVVKRFGSMVKVESANGFVLHCNLEIFMCNFTVSGAYHNKTLGLFGTNNAEYADDFRLPDGSIASDIVDFVRSWELSGDKTCDSLNNEDFVPKCSTKISPRCHALFKAKSSQFSRAFDNVNPAPYLLACEYETSRCRQRYQTSTRHCPTVSAYVHMALQTGVPVQHPAECGACMDSRGRPVEAGRLAYQKDRSLVDMVLIVRDSKSVKKALKNLVTVMQDVDASLKSSGKSPRYWLVGFDGIGHRATPYLQTGNSLVSGSVYNLITALNNLQYRNANRMVSGLDAVKFASKIEFRQASTRIFVLLDSVAIYSGALKEMMEANTLLKNKGIILNTINRYKFKRNIIGKDSFQKRYHLKIPKGERLRNLAFHTADDYTPIVKESRGAIMTIKALMSANEKWMKAFPRSLTEILHSQIKFDKKHCKECKCVMSSEGLGVLRCSRAEGRSRC